MSYPIWNTPAGYLGLIPESEFYSLPLSAYNSGDGTGAVAVVEEVINRAPYGIKDEGIITKIKIIKGGSGYAADFVKITIENGTGFVGIASVINGSISEIIIQDGGYGYSVEQSTITFNRNLEFSKISGEFPPGIYVTKSGSLQGVPIVTDVSHVNKNYKFTIRATNTVTRQVADRTFTMGITNISPPQIYQDQEYLGNYFDGTYFELDLKVINEANPEATLTWSLESGALPKGLTLDSHGVISGYIIPLETTNAEGQTTYSNTPYDQLTYDSDPLYQNAKYTFGVRVYDGINFDIQNYKMLVTAREQWNADTTLSQVNNTVINIDYLTGTQLTADASNVYIPIITTPTQSLPSVRADANFAFKFSGFDPSNAAINWQISSLTEVPFGQNENATYSQELRYDIVSFPVTVSANLKLVTIQGNTANVTLNQVANASIAMAPYSNANVTITGTYFINSAGNISYPTVGIDNNRHVISFWSNTLPALGTGNLRPRVAANITVTQPSDPPGGENGVGFDTARFDQEGSSLPLQLIMDPETGWLTGHVSSQVETTKTYNFDVIAYRQDDNTIQSDPVSYEITVYRDVGDYIGWGTSNNLGSIDNGAISQLKINATAHIFNNGIDSPESPDFSLVSLNSNLPNGLRILKNGLIIGRASFEYFAIDLGNTPIDEDTTIFDNVYEFTVKATASTITDTRTFTLLVNNYNKIPYENLYIKALPKFDERLTFYNIVHNKEIFPEELIYRAQDPWFGRARDIRSLFISGLYPTQLSGYIESMKNNHFTKRINFGKIKTARALDSNFKIKYEVVYIELDDPITDEGRSPAQSQKLRNKNSWIDPQGNDGYDTFYPNSFENMKYDMTSTIGFSYQVNQANAGIPEWMTSTQENGTVLGFTRAVVLAYTVPGASKLIAYRLQTSGLEFNQIDFVIDRYDLDNILTTNYEIGPNQYITGKETTFDRIIRQSTVSHSVDYAIRDIPFQEINNQTISYVRDLGGLDGVTSFENGQLIVFAQQEAYTNYLLLPNDGWNKITSTDNVPVPGYLERENGTKIRILQTNSLAGDDFIIVDDTTDIKIGYTVESADNFALDTTVKSIEGNIVYLENRYKEALSPVITAMSVGTPISFAPINYRSGIWKIKFVDGVDTSVFTPIDASDFGSDSIGFDSKSFDPIIGWLNGPPPAPDQIVTLEFYSPVALNERIQVNNGTSFSQQIIYYDPILKSELSVPEYSISTTTLQESDKFTRFDTYKTKFITNRDSYAAPVTGDKYLKFPKTGVFK